MLSAVDMALKKHKINSVKKSESKRKNVAMHRELAAEGRQNQEIPVEALPDAQEMDVDANILPLQRSSLLPPRPSGRPNQQIQLPHQYRDELPPNLNPPIITDPKPNDKPVESASRASPESWELPKSTAFCTETNSFAIYCKYALGPLTITPDESFMLSFGSSSLESMEKVAPDYFAPFFNLLTFLLMSGTATDPVSNLMWMSTSLSTTSFSMRISKPLTLGQHFQLLMKLNRWMDKNQPSTSSMQSDNFESLPFKPENGWIKGSVSIPVLCDGCKFHSEADAPQFVVDRIWYQRPLQVLKRAFSELAAEKFHTTAFKEYWKPSKDEHEEQIYSDTFTSDVFNDEYEVLQTMLREGLNAKLNLSSLASFFIQM